MPKGADACTLRQIKSWPTINPGKTQNKLSQYHQYYMKTSDLIRSVMRPSGKAPIESKPVGNTTSSVMYPIVGALAEADRELGPNRSWRSVNDRQGKFCSSIYPYCRNDLTKIPELVCQASRHDDVINHFLRENGFDIQLREFSEGDFGVASVLRLLLDWKEAGEIIDVHLHSDSANEKFAGVKLSSDIVTYHTVLAHGHPVAEIATKSDDKVYLTMVDEPVGDGELEDFATRILRGLRENWRLTGSLCFPMVDLNHRVDISWLLGMHTTDESGVPAFIRQALQQTMFSMDHLGAVVRSAAAMAISKGGPPKGHVIDRPFVAIVTRPTVSRPLFIGYLDTPCWKQPKRD